MASKLRYSRALKWAIFKNVVKEYAAQVVETFMFRRGLMMLVSKLNYAASLEKARMDAITTAVGNAGLLYIYSGTQPSGPAGADGTLVAGPFTMGSPFAAGATTALPSVLSPTLPSNVNASTSVQPTWFRIKTSGGTALIDGSAATASADMVIGVPTAGQPVAITSFTLSSGTYGH